MIKEHGTVPLGRLADLSGRDDADRLLIKPIQNRGNAMCQEYAVLRFPTRRALEAFNERAGLRPVVYTVVRKGCAIYKHQKEV